MAKGRNNDKRNVPTNSSARTHIIYLSQPTLLHRFVSFRGGRPIMDFVVNGVYWRILLHFANFQMQFWPKIYVRPLNNANVVRWFGYATIMALVKVRHGDWQKQKVTPPSSSTQLTYGHVYVRLSVSLAVYWLCKKSRCELFSCSKFRTPKKHKRNNAIIQWTNCHNITN